MPVINFAVSEEKKMTADFEYYLREQSHEMYQIKYESI